MLQTLPDHGEVRVLFRIVVCFRLLIHIAVMLPARNAVPDRGKVGFVSHSRLLGIAVGFA
jgi:hypothetical protein